MTTDNYVSISRDPFAREELVRRVIHTEKTCDWCGNNCHNRLFEYGIESDALYHRVNWIKGHFCSVNCMMDFYL